MNSLPKPILQRIIQGALQNRTVCKRWRDAYKLTLKFKTFHNICDEGSGEIMAKFLNQFKTNIPVDHYLNSGLTQALRSENYDVIRVLIQFGADPNWGMRWSLFNQKCELFKQMFELGASDWNYGLFGGCRFGDEELVRKMIYLGAENLNRCLTEARRQGHKEIVKILLCFGANCGKN